jgi:hypothetical protein
VEATVRGSHLDEDGISDMGRNPYCRGLREFLKHLSASDLRLFGIAATVERVGPFGMLDLHSTMEDIAENDDSFLARCDQ